MERDDIVVSFGLTRNETDESNVTIVATAPDGTVKQGTLGTSLASSITQEQGLEVGGDLEPADEHAARPHFHFEQVAFNGNWTADVHLTKSQPVGSPYTDPVLRPSNCVVMALIDGQGEAQTSGNLLHGVSHGRISYSWGGNQTVTREADDVCYSDVP